jgi:hypothetical protein
VRGEGKGSGEEGMGKEVRGPDRSAEERRESWTKKEESNGEERIKDRPGEKRRIRKGEKRRGEAVRVWPLTRPTQNMPKTGGRPHQDGGRKLW